MLNLPHRRWWTLEGEELANAVTSICDALEQDQQPRMLRMQWALGLYEGIPLAALHPESYYAVSDEYGRPRSYRDTVYNLIRSACDTMQAELAGRQRPKPMFITSGADWSTKRRAKKLDRFVEAQLHRPQGVYTDAWDLMQDVFLDTLIWGTGVAKVSADTDRGQLCLERVFPHELMVDPEEARYGNPVNLCNVYGMDVDKAIQAFATVEGDPDGNLRRKMAIESAPEMDRWLGRTRTTVARVTKQIKIREMWRLPLSESDPGKHAFAVDGQLLWEEPWEWSTFPFVFIRWRKHRLGFWATGLSEEGAALQHRVNENEDRLSERFALLGTRRTYYDPAAVDVDQLQANDAETLVPCTDLSSIPREVQTPPVHPAETDWLAQQISRFYDFLGVSQMGASSRKEAGVTAAVAMQTLNDIQTVRFLPRARSYELAFVELAQLILKAVRSLAEDDPSFAVKWPGSSFLEEIAWRDVELKEDMYEVRVAAISQMSRDPAARYQIAQELRAAGDISQTVFLQMLQWPDLDDALQSETAERDYLESLADRYLEAEDDEQLSELGGYESPEGLIADKPGAMQLFTNAYWNAKRDGAPEYNLSLLRNWIRELASQLERAMQPPPGPPEAAMMPGAPPAGPAPEGGPPTPGMPMPNPGMMQ